MSMSTLKINLCCPICGGNEFTEAADVSFRCMKCGEISEPENMSAKTVELPECMSETCIHNPDGYCTLPLLGKTPTLTDDGCDGWTYNENN